MEKVWIRKGKPKRVFEKEDIHYFYWPVEFGIGEFRVGDFRIPTFPIKILDYEPIKTFRHDNKIQVVSRFHYRILTYFNNPKVLEGRVVVDFSFGSHSPYVHSDAEVVGYDLVIDAMDSKEIAVFQFLVSLYVGLISGKLQLEVNHLEDYDVEMDNVPEECIFRPESSAAILWVGFHPTREETPEFLWRILRPEYI